MLQLASASPRRAELLRQLGVSFRVLPDCAVDETPWANETAPAYAQRLARAKAAAGWTGLSSASDWVLGADTCVVCDGQLLGKPSDAAAAAAMLAQLAGRSHQVYTSVCLLQANRSVLQTGCTEVVFAPLTPADIHAYVATQEWQGKAGGYAIQGFAAAFVSQLQGSYSNVVGLPLFETAQLLREVGLAYWQE